MPANEQPTARRIHLTSALVVLATFIAGAAAGMGVSASFRHHPHGPGPGGPGGPRRPPWLEELNLTAEQQPVAQKIFDKHHEAMEALIKEGFPKVQAINEAMENELRGILTPEQMTRLAEIKKHRPMGGRHPGMMGPQQKE